MYNLSDLKLISFPLFSAQESFLTIYEEMEKVPFPICRVFMVKANDKCTRGFHAHKECTQLLIALQGKCKVVCDDGHTRKNIFLDKASEGLLIPPSLWAEQEYRPDTILLVLTDMPYNENDYIRNYESFLKYRKM